MVVMPNWSDPVQEAVEAHTASTARELGAGVLAGISRTLEPQGLEGVSSYSYHIPEDPEALGNRSTTTEPPIISRLIVLLPGVCAPAQLLCQRFHRTPRGL